MEKPVKEFMGVRVPPDMLAVLKGRADSQGVKLSQVVIEALALYIDEVILLKCRRCGNPNDEGSQYCNKCGNGLTPDAEGMTKSLTNYMLKWLIDDPAFYESFRESLAKEKADRHPSDETREGDRP